MREYPLYIDGEFVPATGGEMFESTNPFSGEPVAKVARGSAEDIDNAVKAARRAFDEGPWPDLTQEERSGYLFRIAEKMEERGKELVSLVVAESGSTYRKAKGEVFLAGKHMAWFAKAAQSIQDTEVERLSKPGVSKNLLVREPIGVCGQITPWNFPLQMVVWKIAPAIAVGNTVVLKPAEETPATAMILAEIIDECGLPPGVVNIVAGFGEEAGAALARHPDVDKVAFTGSTAVGKHVMHDASDTLKKVTLELGGKSANIVFADADLDQAVDAALYAGFFHTGQCCTAGTRLLLEKSIHDVFVDKLVAKAKAMHLGDPGDKATDMGPLVSKKQREAVLRYIELGKKEGATCVVGGGVPDADQLKSGNFVLPTVFTHVNNKMAIAQEEIFGPVISVIPFETPEEAVQIANDSPYGLAGAVWSRDADKALAVARKLRAGTVWVNEYHLISEKAPFGGYKQSGIGRELGEAGLLEYTETKHIHVDELHDRDKKFWYDAVVPRVTTG